MQSFDIGTFNSTTAHPEMSPYPGQLIHEFFPDLSPGFIVCLGATDASRRRPDKGTVPPDDLQPHGRNSAADGTRPQHLQNGTSIVIVTSQTRECPFR